MQNKVVLITGANTGIGFFTALELARQGAQIVMACRTEARARAARDQIRLATGNQRVETIPLDLGDFQSIRACANELLTRIQESAPARIVTVASRAHRYVSRLRFEDLTVRNGDSKALGCVPMPCIRGASPAKSGAMRRSSS